MKLLKISLTEFVEILTITFFIFLIFMLSSCRHGAFIPEAVINQPPPEASGITCDPDSVYFQNTILPLFVSNCAKSGCHDAATAESDIILDNYVNIITTGEIVPFNPNHGKILDAITTTDPDDMMPPQGYSPLTQQQIDQITLWINQGALNNTCEGCNPDTINITYTGRIKPILDSKCIGCHNTSNTSGSGVNLDNYNSAKASAINGSLFGSVNHSTGYIAMPQGGNKLPQCEIDAIRIWADHQTPQ